MNLIKTSALSFIATLVKMVSGLVINKAISIYIGPSGLALIGQFQNFSQLAQAAGQGGINSGVTKYVAEYGKDDNRIPSLLSTAGKISLYSSVIVGIGIVIFSKVASLQFFESENYNYVFIIFGFTIVLFVLNNLLLSIINGLKDIKTFIIINITQSIYSLIFTTILIVFLGLNGALIALVTNQSFIFFVVLWMLRKHQIINLKSFGGSFDASEAKKLGGFSLMTITSVATVPLSHLFVRNYIGEHISWDAAGYWQALWYISSTYLMVVTTVLSIYFLPRLSEIKDTNELKLELANGYKIIIPAVILMSFIIYGLRGFIVKVLFTEEFLPVVDLFLWQLIGDVLMISGFLLGYISIAKAMTKIFIFKQIFLAVVFVFASIFFIDKYGLIGVTYAYVFLYLMGNIFGYVVYKLYINNWRKIFY